MENEDDNIEQTKINNNKVPNFIRAFYWFSLGIFIVFIIIYASRINSINVYETSKEVFENGDFYQLKTDGQYSVVEFGKGEFGVFDYTTGELIEDTFFLMSKDAELLKITPHNIIKAKPSIIYFLFKQGIFTEKVISLSNPAKYIIILLPLFLGIAVDIVTNRFKRK